MAATPAYGSPLGSAPRAPRDVGGAFRTILVLAAVLVAVLAVLALVNSFFLIKKAPGPPDATQPAPGAGGEEGGGGGGGGQLECEDYADIFFWAFIVLAAITIVLLALAYALRGKYNGEILTNIWGILSLIGLFFTLVAIGIWQLTSFTCKGDCGQLMDRAYNAFLTLLVVATLCCAMGVFFAHRTGKNFFRTGWGILGVVLFLPMLISLFFWYILVVTCRIKAPCIYLDTLQLVFWLSLIALAACLTVGILLRVHRKVGLWHSGWAVLAILFGVTAGMHGYLWYQVDQLCSLDPDEPPNCKQLEDQMKLYFWIAVGVTVASFVLAFVIHRKDPKKAFGSMFAILGYVGLGAVLLLGIGWYLVHVTCEGKEEQQGQGEQGQGGQGSGTGPGSGTGSGSASGTGSGSGTRTGTGTGGGTRTGTGTGGGGNQPGGGGGGGNVGGGGGGNVGAPSPTVPPINPQMFLWLAAILAVIAVLAVLCHVFKNRGGPAKTKDAMKTAPPQQVQASERSQLLRLLDQRDLTSAEAVIAAYRAFLAWCTDKGLLKAAQETPTEHGRRVLKAYPLPAQSMEDFIRAYEVARLSPREPTPKERQMAVSFSRQVSSQATMTPAGGESKRGG